MNRRHQRERRAKHFEMFTRYKQDVGQNKRSVMLRVKQDRITDSSAAQTRAESRVVPL